jgi:hypothetical protein
MAGFAFSSYVHHLYRSDQFKSMLGIAAFHPTGLTGASASLA